MSAAALAAIFGTSFVVSLSGALSPGSLLTVTTREAGCRIIDRRVHQGLLAVCGVFLVALGGWVLASGIGYVA